MKTVLLVEDNDDEIYFMKRMCADTKVPHALQIVTTGEAAIGYLSAVAPYNDRSTYSMPDLLFLDLRLPKINGYEIIKWGAQPSAP